jgi:hypothetical protein
MFWSRAGSVAPVATLGRRRLPLFLVLLGVGAGVLASCAGQRMSAPPQTSAVRPQVPAAPRISAPSPAAPRPARKPSPPAPSGSPAGESGGEDFSGAESPPVAAALVPEPSTLSGTAQISTSSVPAGPPTLQASELIGLDQSAATRLFGQAAERSEEPPATVWRYKNASCELALFFYLDLRSGRMRTLRYALKGDDANAPRRQDCLRSLLVARGG